MSTPAEPSPREKTRGHRTAPTSTSGGAAVLERLLSFEEVAVLLATSTRHVKRLVYERRIPYVKVGRWVRFELSAIAGWLEEHTVAPAPAVSRRRRKIPD